MFTVGLNQTWWACDYNLNTPYLSSVTDRFKVSEVLRGNFSCTEFQKKEAQVVEKRINSGSP